MEQTKQAMRRYEKRIPGIEGYALVISKVEKNCLENPDIAIESCKSLIEGLCKKSLSLVSEKYNASKKLRDECEKDFPKLLNHTFGMVFQRSVEKEMCAELALLISNKVRLDRFAKEGVERFEKNAKTAIKKIAAIRHTRGDICHGRIYPKVLESEVHLAESVSLITDGICSLMIHELARQLPEKIEEADLKYEELPEYNEWLDTSVRDFPISKVLFSALLGVVRGSPTVDGI